MYESHFGLSAPPFQLNPDPAFYFGSQGHANALSYLRFGVHQGEGFIVVTGDIGAGKTTLLRTLIGELDTEEVIAAQVLNTQLEAGELVQSILSAFGVPNPGVSKAQALASLEAFLRDVSATGRRALLIVDEAQNLGAGAIEELRMLSNFQLGNRALLQSFLVGQPELRKQLESRQLEQLRQRIIASCHLGPLTADETRAYIEHRLCRVGWTSNPKFEPEAFRAIYAHTGGIPRRINLLCNRLLLAAFLGELSDIAPDLVTTTATELARETGARPLVEPVHAVQPPLSEPRGELPAQTRDNTVVEIVARAEPDLASLSHPILCVGDSPLSYLQFATLAHALRSEGTFPSLIFVNPGDMEAAQTRQLLPDFAESFGVEVHLRIASNNAAERISSVTLKFGELLDRLEPACVIASGASDMVLSCVYLATKRGTLVGRLGAGRRRDTHSLGCDLNAVLIDRMSQVLYTPMLKTHYTLYREGIPSERMVCIGNLHADGLRRLLSGRPPVSDTMKALNMSRDQMRRALRGFAFVSAQVGEGDISEDDLPRFARLARDLGKETLVVWPVSEATSDAIASGKAHVILQRSGVVLVPDAGYSTHLGLLRGATCVIAGPAWGLVEESDSLDIPSIVVYPSGDVPVGAPGGVIAKIPCDPVACIRALHEILERGRGDDEVVDSGDGTASSRVIEHLRRWLPQSRPNAVGQRLNADTAR